MEEKEKDKVGQAVYLTPLNLFGSDPEEEKPHFDDTVPQKLLHEKSLETQLDAIIQSAGSRIAQTFASDMISL